MSAARRVCLRGRTWRARRSGIGTDESALWAVATTDASNGSVNSMHDSYRPLGGLAPMFNMGIGEVIFGGVGSGLYGMIFYAVIAVFIGGLMVGRTPEYLGKKIGAREVKLVGDRGPRAVPPRARARRRSPPSRPPGWTGPLEPGARTGSARSSTRSCRRGTTTARRSPASRRAGPSTRSPAAS